MTKKQWLILTVIVAGIAAFVALPDLLLHPDSVVLGIDGDAAKNYYTFIYQSLYGDGLWFEGMNYPYGEHIIFTDAQPLFSIPLSLLNKFFSINPIAMMHLLILVGFMLSIILLYKILLRFATPRLAALIFAVLITTMSPQVFRLTEHFSLSYFCVVPAIFYLLLAYHQERKKKHIILLAVFALVVAWVHPYYLLMVCLWMLLYTVAYLLSKPSEIKLRVTHTLPIIGVALLSVIVFQLILILTDPITDRPTSPQGILANRTQLSDIVTSQYSILGSWLSNLGLVDTVAARSEGYTYIGIVPLVLLIVGLFIAIRNRIATKKDPEADNLGIWLFIAIVMLLIGMAFPFTYCFSCLDKASFLKQFRAVGRFSWSFYYIIALLSVVILNRLLLVNRSSINRKYYGLVLAVAVIWAIDAKGYITYMHSIVQERDKNFVADEKSALQKLLAKHNLKPTDFQSILSLPYVHIGSEKLGVGAAHTATLLPVFNAALDIQLPIMNVMLSRTSWEQTFSHVKIAGGPYTEKKTLAKSDKPVLLMVPTDYQSNPDEQYLISTADLIGSYDGVSVYQLSLTKLLAKDYQLQQEAKDIASRLGVSESYSSAAGFSYYNWYDDSAAKDVLFGTGAAVATTANTKLLLSEPFRYAEAGELYEFSVWALVGDDNHKSPFFNINCIDSAGSVLTTHVAYGSESTDSYGLWLRISTYFTVPQYCSRIDVTVLNLPNPTYLALDELLIRKTTDVVIRRDEQEHVLVNNHIVK